MSVASLACGAADLYVSPQGHDDDKRSQCSGGSIANPYYTLENAIQCAANGDIIYMRGGEYSYSQVTHVDKSVSIKNYDGESPRILIVGTELPFFAIEGAYDFLFEGISVSGFNVNGQNIPCSSFIYNLPGSALGNVVLNNVNFQNFESYDGYPEKSNVISGMYKELTISNSSFTTTSSYYSPGTHISAGATSFLNIINNQFLQTPITSFIHDVNDRSALATVILSGNTFGVSGSSLVVAHSNSAFIIKDSVFTGNVTGPICSGKSASVSMQRVVFDGSSKPVLITSSGCVASISDSQIINSYAGSYLLQCSGASMSITDSAFVDDENVATCNDCAFVSTNNDLSKIGATRVGTCPL